MRPAATQISLFPSGWSPDPHSRHFPRSHEGSNRICCAAEGTGEVGHRVRAPTSTSHDRIGRTQPSASWRRWNSDAFSQPVEQSDALEIQLIEIDIRVSRDDVETAPFWHGRAVRGVFTRSGTLRRRGLKP